MGTGCQEIRMRNEFQILPKKAQEILYVNVHRAICIIIAMQQDLTKQKQKIRCLADRMLLAHQLNLLQLRESKQ